MPGTLESAIHSLVQTRIDTCIFDQRCNNNETGRESYDPKVFLKVVLFGLLERIDLFARDRTCVQRECGVYVAFLRAAT